MERQNFKTKRILIITLICVIFVVSIIIGLLLFNEHDVIEDKLINDNEPINDKIDENNKKEDNIEDFSQEEIDDEDKLNEEKYSVIFMDSDGNILQSSYFTKGTTPYYSGKSLSSKSRKFNTWIPSITTVNGNQAYIATYFYPESSTYNNNSSSSSGSGSTPLVNNTYASIIYNDIEGNQQSLILESGTTINFSAGEHGIYDSIPSSITLTDNQQLDTTDSSYSPSKVEVNYIFKGFSYSGNTIKCEYSLANNTVNVECKQVENTIIKNNVLYTQLEYLEGTGTQYINTGINRDENSKYEFEFQIDVKSSVSYTNIWGCDERERSTQAHEKLYVYTQNSTDSVRLGDENRYDTAVYPLVTGQKYHFEIGDGKVKMNGTEKTNIQWTSANNSDCIFWTRIKDVSNQDCLQGKFYYYKTWKGSNLKLDLIPAKRLSDNVLGMLDLVNGGFLTNAGTGVFKQPNTINILGINAGKVMASGSYDTGPLTLTAVPNEGYKFVGWTDNTTSATRTVTIGDNTVYTALFEHN